MTSNFWFMVQKDKIGKKIRYWISLFCYYKIVIRIKIRDCYRKYYRKLKLWFYNLRHRHAGSLTDKKAFRIKKFYIPPRRINGDNENE